MKNYTLQGIIDSKEEEAFRNFSPLGDRLVASGSINYYYATPRWSHTDVIMQTPRGKVGVELKNWFRDPTDYRQNKKITDYVLLKEKKLEYIQQYQKQEGLIGTYLCIIIGGNDYYWINTDKIQFEWLGWRWEKRVQMDPESDWGWFKYYYIPKTETLHMTLAELTGNN